MNSKPAQLQPGVAPPGTRHHSKPTALPHLACWLGLALLLGSFPGQAGGATAFATRQMPYVYFPDDALKITDNANPPPETVAYEVWDRPPAGWLVTNISRSGGLEGRLDAISGHVEWGPYFDNAHREFSYETVPPPNATGDHVFVGEISVDGASTPIAGRSVIASVLGGMTDANTNGLPDVWERVYGLEGINSAALDSDGDGMNNLDEYRAGTDPRDSNSVLRVDNVGAIGNSLLMEFRAMAGLGYCIEYRYVNATNWLVLTRINPQPTNGVVPFSDLITEPERMYRVRAEAYMGSMGFRWDAGNRSLRPEIKFGALGGYGYAVLYADQVTGPWQLLNDLPIYWRVRYVWEPSTREVTVRDLVGRQLPPMRFYRVRRLP